MTRNECAHVFALLSEYLDHELPAGTCEELERHLGGCPQCVQFVRSLKRSVELCHQAGACWSVPPVDPTVKAKLRRVYEEMLARRRSLVT